MTIEEFEEMKPELLQEMESAIRKAARQEPEGFLVWLGMSVTPENIRKVKEAM